MVIRASVLVFVLVILAGALVGACGDSGYNSAPATNEVVVISPLSLKLIHVHSANLQ